MAKKVFEFKLKMEENEMITPYAGLGVFGGMWRSLGLDKEVDIEFPQPGSGAGFSANTYISPVVMMLLGGGRVIEDIRKIKADKGLQKICNMKRVPSADAIGDWLRRESREKAKSLDKINNNMTVRILRKAKEAEFTLDIDATEIEAYKREAEWTYNGVKGYMPMLGFIPELGWCCGYEFREGNISPADRNKEFTGKIIKRVKTSGKRISRVRSDSAAYQSGLMNDLNGENIKYAITVDKDESIKKAIRRIKESEWIPLEDKDGIRTDREYTEIIHSMNKSDHSFRVIMMRWKNPELDLFKKTEEYCYHGIATNYLEEDKDSRGVILWHNERGNSENYNKELKLGFGMDYMPCGEYGANAVWFGIGVLAYNLFMASKMYLFPHGWLKKTIRTIRWQFIEVSGKIVKHAKTLVLKLCSTLRETYEIYKRAMRTCNELQL